MKKSQPFVYLCLSISLIFTPIYLPAPSWAQASQGSIHEANAESSEESAESNRNTGISQSVAAATCLTACGLVAVGGPYAAAAEQACFVVSTGATVHDLVEMRELSMSVAATIAAAMSGGTMLYNNLSTAIANQMAGEKAAEKGGGEFSSSCISGALHSVTAIMKFRDMKEADDSAQESKELAKSFKAAPGNATTRVRNANISGGTSSTGRNSNLGLAGTAALTSAQSGAQGVSNMGGKSCTPAQQAGNSQAFFSCLSAVDSSAAGIASRPGFTDAFDKITKNSLDQLLKNTPNRPDAGTLISAGMGPNFKGASKLKEALDKVAQDPELMGRYQQQLAALEAKGGYTGGGQDTTVSGNSKANSGKKKGFFDKLLGKKSKGLSATGEKFDLPKKDVDAEAIMRDRNRDLFKRVSQAYQGMFKMNQVEKRPWALYYNQIMSRQSRKPKVRE